MRLHSNARMGVQWPSTTMRDPRAVRGRSTMNALAESGHDGAQIGSNGSDERSPRPGGIRRQRIGCYKGKHRRRAGARRIAGLRASRVNLPGLREPGNRIPHEIKTPSASAWHAGGVMNDSAPLASACKRTTGGRGLPSGSPMNRAAFSLGAASTEGDLPGIPDGGAPPSTIRECGKRVLTLPRARGAMGGNDKPSPMAPPKRGSGVSGCIPGRRPTCWSKQGRFRFKSGRLGQGQVAPTVERGFEEPCGGGSNPSLSATDRWPNWTRRPATNGKIEGSSPSRSARQGNGGKLGLAGDCKSLPETAMRIVTVHSHQSGHGRMVKLLALDARDPRSNRGAQTIIEEERKS